MGILPLRTAGSQHAAASPAGKTFRFCPLRGGCLPSLPRLFHWRRKPAAQGAQLSPPLKESSCRRFLKGFLPADMNALPAWLCTVLRERFFFFHPPDFPSTAIKFLFCKKSSSFPFTKQKEYAIILLVRGALAQLVAHNTGSVGVRSSNLLCSTGCDAFEHLCRPSAW